MKTKEQKKKDDSLFEEIASAVRPDIYGLLFDMQSKLNNENLHLFKKINDRLDRLEISLNTLKESTSPNI